MAVNENKDTKKDTKKVVNENKYTNFHIIIEALKSNKNVNVDIDKLIKYFSKLGDYWLILHNKDLDKEKEGVLERPHFHITISLKNRDRKSTFLNKISNALSIEKETITITNIYDLTAMIRYLIHQDDDDKTAYDPFLVKTNNKPFYEMCILRNNVIIDINYLAHAVCLSKGNKYTIMKSIGIENYIRYRPALLDLLNEYYQGNLSSSEMFRSDSL